jgi:hypothetical protein
LEKSREGGEESDVRYSFLSADTHILFPFLSFFSTVSFSVEFKDLLFGVGCVAVWSWLISYESILVTMDIFNID